MSDSISIPRSDLTVSYKDLKSTLSGIIGAIYTMLLNLSGYLVDSPVSRVWKRSTSGEEIVGHDRSIDRRSIVTIIVFFIVSKSPTYHSLAYPVWLITGM